VKWDVQPLNGIGELSSPELKDWPRKREKKQYFALRNSSNWFVPDERFGKLKEK